MSFRCVWRRYANSRTRAVESISNLTKESSRKKPQAQKSSERRPLSTLQLWYVAGGLIVARDSMAERVFRFCSVSTQNQHASSPCHARIKRGGTGGPDPPEKKHKNIEFLSNTGPDPLKITKLPRQHSMCTPFLVFRI